MKKTNTFFMKTGLLSLFMLALSVRLSYAQTEGSYTLQQCIDYALKNSTSVKAAEFDEYIAKAQIKEITGIGLPQISGGATIMDNPQLQRMFLNYDGSPTSFASSFFPPGTPIGVYGLPNMFQLRSNGDAKISASQLLFSGSYFVGLKASKTFAELSHKNTNLTKSQAVENVTKAFYSVLITNERKALLDANIASLDSSLRHTKASNQQGFVEKIDVDRLEVTFNNLLTEKSKADLMAEMMLYLLKFQMGFDVNTPLSLSGDVKDINENVAKIPTIDSSAYLNRPEYSLLKTQLKLEGLNLKNKRMYYLPTLAAFGNYGVNRGSTSLGGLFEKRGTEVLYPVGSDFKDISGTWFNYSNYGLSLNVPIFSGFTQNAKVQQSKIALQKIQNNIDALKQASSLQAKQAEIGIRNGIFTVENQKRNMELASEVKRVSKIKYEQGIGSNLEVITAETSYKEAQTNYYNALFDLLISGVDYQKATGTLYKE